MPMFAGEGFSVIVTPKAAGNSDAIHDRFMKAACRQPPGGFSIRPAASPSGRFGIPASVSGSGGKNRGALARYSTRIPKVPPGLAGIRWDDPFDTSRPSGRKRGARGADNFWPISSVRWSTYHPSRRLRRLPCHHADRARQSAARSDRRSRFRPRRPLYLPSAGGMKSASRSHRRSCPELLFFQELWEGCKKFRKTKW